MKLNSTTTIAASPAHVRETFADPQALLGGLEIISLTPTGPGEWDMQVEMSGRTESGTLRHVGVDGDTVRHEARSAGMKVDIAGTCAPNETGGTELTVNVEMSATSMKAKMLLPALSLASAQIEKGLDKALGKLARRLGEPAA